MSASDELMRLEHRLESLGIGYTRMELCIIELSRQIQALVERNAAMLQALADKEEADDQGEPVGYLSSKRR